MLLAVVLLLFLLYYFLSSACKSFRDKCPVQSEIPFLSYSHFDSLPAESSSTSGQRKLLPAKITTTPLIPCPFIAIPGLERAYYPSKLKPGATVDVNTADTLLLQRVPGIGPSFARRIYKYRQLLGGYYCVEQLQEVYGMDREKYDQISPYMEVRTAVQPIDLNK